MEQQITPYRHTSSDDAKLRSEVEFLRRKVKYIQGVSTVFRQKIAMIIRECAKQPTLFGQDLQRMYATAVGDLVQAEARDGADGSQSAADAALFSPIRKHPRTDQAKEDVRKAHQLCLVLQEKNAIKERELQLRAAHEELQRRFAELDARHNRLVELQATGAGAAVAQRELNDHRVQELQVRLTAATEEIVLLRRRGGVSADSALGTFGGTEHVPTAADGDAGATVSGGLQRQNAMLRTRMQRLKDELALVRDAADTRTAQAQQQMDSLIGQVHRLRRDLASREDSIRRLLMEKTEVAREVVRLRASEEAMREQLAGANTELEQLRAAGAVAESGRGGERDDLVAAADGYARRAEVLEKTIAELREEVERHRSVAAEKDVRIHALGSQTAAFRARLEALETHREQRGVHASMVHDVQQRLFSAVDDIQRAQSSSGLAQQITELNGRIKGLEGVELQLRQKEDELAAWEDRCEQQERAAGELRDALQGISTLFMALPRSVDYFERIIIELDAYKEEVARAATERRPPDVVRLEGVVDLRCLESEAARRAHQRTTGKRGRALGESDARGTFTVLTDDDEDEDDDGAALEALLQIPPPPTLVDITASLIPKEIVDGNRPIETAAIVTPPRSAVAASSLAPTPAGPASVSETDARLTFQLFDESGRGELPADMVSLCLSTLGLPSSLCPSSSGPVTLAEFVALCLGGK